MNDADDTPRDSRHGHPHGRGGLRHGRHGRRGGRLFDYGELRLLVLAMISERPQHGYELMKGIEDRFGGSYSPSPGVIYPTLAWLADMGFTLAQPDGGGRKLNRITEEGRAFLDENRAAADELLARSGGPGRAGVPAPVLRAMENLKLALRLRLREGALDPQDITAIAAAIDAAATVVEQKR